MNTPENSMAAAEGATHSLDPGQLTKLSMSQLQSLFEAVHLAAEMLQGIICQPRFGDSAGADTNPAGDELDRIIHHLHCCRSMIAEVAKSSAPTDPDEAEQRAWTILQRQASDRDHLPDFAALAAGLVAHQAHVEFHASRRTAA